MERNLALTVGESEGRPRLDLFLARHLPDASRSSIRRWILSGDVTLEGRRPKPSLRLRPGDRVVLTVRAPALTHLVPESIPIGILHEDPDFLVVMKPAGMVVHPGAGVRSGTLVHALLGLKGSLSTMGGQERPGIVHRLDRDTSGLLLVARNDSAHRALSAQFAGRQVGKVYLALVWGRPDPPEGRIEVPLGRHPAVRTRMAIRPIGGREAITDYRILENLGPISFLEIRIRTGRTHQIRVHLRHLGHPIVGDTRYGGRGFKRIRSPGFREVLEAFRGLALHASALEFRHPSTGAALRFHAPLPDEFRLLLQRLRGVR